jgi:hypothetical protein
MRQVLVVTLECGGQFLVSRQPLQFSAPIHISEKSSRCLLKDCAFALTVPFQAFSFLFCDCRNSASFERSNKIWQELRNVTKEPLYERQVGELS